MMRVIVGKHTHPPRSEEIRWEKILSEEILSLALTNTFFNDARAFVFVGAINSEKGREIIAMAKDLLDSPHTFIFEEEKLLKKETEALAAAGVQIEIVQKEKKEYAFDPFGLTVALAKRDKKKLWLGLVQALRAGEKPEAIAGLLHWKVRDMLGNFKTGAYTPKELKKLSRDLVFVYHDSHRGSGDLALLLERLALKL